MMNDHISATEHSIHPIQSISPSNSQPPSDLGNLDDFKYDTLESRGAIRVLSLLPGVDDDEIRCSLEVAQLDDYPPYEALSYTWGDPKVTQPIRCGEGAFNVTVNLHAALKRLRQINGRRLLWVDAICINQKSEVEKGEQVQQMAEIYSKALRVLIWLGEETESVPVAFQAIRCTRKLFPAGNAYHRYAGMTPEQLEVYESCFRDFMASGMMMRILRLWEPILQLFCRPWFTRKWIIQEVVQGKNGLVICGSHTLQWEILEDTLVYTKLFKFSAFWHQYLTDDEARLFVTVPIIATMRIAELDRPLDQIIYYTRRLAATESRDQIISMLHLASDLSSDDMNFLVDYSHTTTAYMTKLFRWSIETKNSLDYLSSGFGQADVVDATQPSWLPNLSSWDSHGSAPRSSMDFRASMESQIQVNFVSDLSAVSFAGTMIDEIAVLGTLSTKKTINSSGLRTSERIPELEATIMESSRLAREFVLECKAIATHDSNALGTAGFQSLCNAMSWESLRQFVPVKNMTPEYICDEIAKLLAVATGIEESATTVTFADIDSTVITHIFANSIGSRFCRTTDGRLGSMPKYAEVGDKICLFYGGNVPYVIRPRGDGTYRYIGDCYLDGVMHGETMVDSRKTEIFTLV